MRAISRLPPAGADRSARQAPREHTPPGPSPRRGGRIRPDRPRFASWTLSSRVAVEFRSPRMDGGADAEALSRLLDQPVVAWIASVDPNLGDLGFHSPFNDISSTVIPGSMSSFSAAASLAEIDGPNSPAKSRPQAATRSYRSRSSTPKHSLFEPNPFTTDNSSAAAGSSAAEGGRVAFTESLTPGVDATITASVGKDEREGALCLACS